MGTNPQIWDKEKDFDFSEAIKPETIQQPPSYDYGRSQEPLDYKLLKNKPDSWWAKYYCWTFNNPWTTWNYSITWIWFTPKMITFQCVYSAENWSMSWWETNWINSRAYFHFYLSWSPYYSTSNSVLYVRNSAWTSTTAGFISFDTDWFTLIFNSVWLWVEVQYQCFW